ncbi:DUF1659 domain-containing protein [Bacillus chungangensis]|uniref:DUF1659 domain-containing protein n=1 Tax=Bacillus chungangensis TaxID=587633 RepID=A0ABT9WYZ1_9BACI|nr:DUF1659 domain-containing protein [Bacillus chungangensis]MDQ0178507.1 hypothetical protein [Bacillus chungangensis]
MVQAKLRETKLKLVFSNGVDDNGNPNLQNKTYQYINLQATPDQLHETAVAIAVLTVNPLEYVERIDSSEIRV